METNPELIQAGDLTNNYLEQLPAPVFLIHDGGGTTFAYHCLDSLGRPTYGIFNPHFRNGKGFEGGIRGMGSLYADIIRRTCAHTDLRAERNADGSVNILIGGWSMGGLLSLEIAKLMIGDPDVRIVGVLMMDSMYPVDPPKVPLETLDHEVLRKSKNASLSLQAMKEALRVIHTWDPPVWSGDLATQRPLISLLRAADSIPTGNDRMHLVDIYRSDRTLGWDRYDTRMFVEIVDVKGDHFEMFSFQHIPEISQAIKSCLDKLEAVSFAPYL